MLQMDCTRRPQPRRLARHSHDDSPATATTTAARTAGSNCELERLARNADTPPTSTRGVNVTCDVVGGETETVSVAEDATYADLCRAVGFSPHEVTVLVDGRPVAEDGTVTEERVELLRLVKGGGRAGATGRAR